MSHNISSREKRKNDFKTLNHFKTFSNSSNEFPSVNKILVLAVRHLAGLTYKIVSLSAHDSVEWYFFKHVSCNNPE